MASTGVLLKIKVNKGKSLIKGIVFLNFDVTDFTV